MQSGPAKRRRPLIVGSIAFIVFFVAALTDRILDYSDGIGLWLPVAVQVVATVTFVACLARVVLDQRDDYWKERGRDPKDPRRSMP